MDFAFLFHDWLGKPAWMWLAFMAIVATLLTLDLGVLHKENREIEARESLLLSAGYISLGVAFGVWVWWQLGPQSGLEYMTGFAIEKTLAMDNVFVIAMIFSFFAIPRLYQHRVLFWGILGVIVLLIFIAWGMGWDKFPPAWGLGITVGILASGILFSLWKTRDDADGMSGRCSQT